MGTQHIFTPKTIAQSLGIENELPQEKIEVLQAQSEAEAVQEKEDVVNANFDANVIKQLAEDHLDMLAGLAMPDVFRHNFPPVLLAAWDLLKQNVENVINNPKVALGIPRGHGKTTLIKLFIVYCILFTDRKFILVMSATATLAENIIADVIDMLNEKNIINLFGWWRTGMEKDTQALKKFGYRGRVIILAAIGAEGSVRGLNLKNERPDVEVFDDIQTKECSESQVMSESLERWMIGTAMKAKSPRGCLFLFAGNMFPGPHSILKKLKKNPTWIKFISGGILADGNVLWPELRSKESLIKEFDDDIAMGHPEIFLSEVMNDTEANINTKTDLSRIAPWKWQEYELPQGKFIIIDPSNDKKTSDAVAIGYFEVYDEKPGLRTVIEDRLSPGDTIRKALILALETNTKCIVVESNAYQYSLLYWFGVICEQIGLEGFHFVEVYTGSYSKNHRISDTLKALTAGEIILHGDVRNKVISQITNWNPMKRDNVDNILDLLSYCQRSIELYAPLMSTEVDLSMADAMKAHVRSVLPPGRIA